ncbi:MAG: Rpn family recombination-promoting nuclease/putative transposase [Hormoscilla sp.]
MKFINPKTDFAFKKIFGSEQSKDILISFLNAMLYDGKETIADLTIINPYQAPRLRGLKDTYLDVKAELADRKQVIIEMQVLNTEGFEKRILYNAAKAYSIQLESGKNYTLLNPVIALTITDFKMFPDAKISKVISKYALKETDFLSNYLVDDIELVFVELPNFDKKLEQLETLTDKWLFFIKNAKALETVPESMSSVPEIQKAFEIANIATLDPSEMEDLEKREIYIHDQRNAIEKAENTGMKKTQVEIAKRLLAVLDEETISQTTGLSLEDVQKLKQN